MSIIEPTPEPPLPVSGSPPPERLDIRRFTAEEAPEDFARACALRADVFVSEQQVPEEEELDCYEDESTHWLALDAMSGKPLATGRMRAYQEGCQMRPVAKLERIAVAKAARGRGVGERLTRTMLEFAVSEGFEQAILNSQTHAVGFYEKLGFVAEGDEFDDAGIPHFTMRRML